LEIPPSLIVELVENTIFKWLAMRGKCLASPVDMGSETVCTAKDKDVRLPLHPTGSPAAVERFRELFQLASDAMLLADGSGRILLANGQADKLFGYTRDELLGQSVDLLLPPRLRGRHHDHRAAYNTNPHPRPMGSALSLFAIRKDGTEFPAEISLSPVPDSDGSLVIAAIYNITERYRLKEALQLSEERFRLLVEAVQEYAIFMLDAEGRVETWTSAAERLIGYSATEVIGRHFSLFYPEEQIADGAPMRVLLAAVRDGHYREEGLRLRKDGSRFEAEVTVTPLWDEQGRVRGFAKVARDVTARKAAESERERLIAALEEKNVALERFSYTASHDLKGPLFTMRAYLDQLAKSVDEGDAPRFRADLARIVRASERMHHFLDDLLELSRKGSIVGPREEVSLREVAQEATEILGGLLRARAVAVHISEDLPVVHADRRRLLEVLQNLMENSSKFMGGQPSPLIEVGTRANDKDRVFFVRDNGIGIPSEDQARVFGLFQRLSTTAEGSGVGLALVRSIIEAHGGRIWVESSGLGAGSTFCFTLAP